MLDYRFDRVGRYVVTGRFLSDDGEVELESPLIVDVMEHQPALVMLYAVGMRERVNPGERVMIQAVVQSPLTGNHVEAQLSWTRNGVMHPAAQDVACLMFTAGDAGAVEEVGCVATVASGSSSRAVLQIQVNVPPWVGPIRMIPELSPLPAPGTVTLSIEEAYDPDSDLPLTYQWFTRLDGRYVPLSPQTQAAEWTTDLPVGRHEIFVRAVDSDRSSTDSGMITVEVVEP